MIRHIVFFRFKSDTSASDRADFVSRLRALSGRVPGIEQLEVGEDFLHTPRSYDVALVVTFRDRAAIDAYQVHPNHVPVPQRAREICDSIASVDYET